MTRPPLTMVPDELIHRQQMADKYFPQLPDSLRAAVSRLLVTSDFAYKHWQLMADMLVVPGWVLAQDYAKLIQTINLTTSSTAVAKALRQFRHWHLLRLMLLEYAGMQSTAETLFDWSACADALIQHALRFCQQELATRYGLPRDRAQKPVQLVTIAMGKLGGQELNFSSDIDLIFAYTADGETDGNESIANQQFFTKLIQQFTQLMQQPTADGFVFRIDLRLRPNGDSGPLVASLAAMENYYQEQGRDWERYAMVKARVIGDSNTAQRQVIEGLFTPFVYRRYVDFSVIESLRSMKAMIEREVLLNPRLDDIKRGQGGIREIEFIIQNVQLIRGGRMPQIRLAPAMAALAVLQHERLIPRAEALQQAYLFLRRLENCLQILDDQQTHTLPSQPLKQWQIAHAMDFADWPTLLDKLHQYQRIVSHSFKSILGRVEEYEDDKRLLLNQLASLWQGHVEPNMAVNLLASLGFTNPERCYQILYDFRHSPRCRRMSQAARMRLDQLMVMLLKEMSDSADAASEIVLLQLIKLLENIVGRSAYLALLGENPLALRELLFWFSHSPFISSLLVTHPFLLEILLDQDNQWRPGTLKILRQELAQRLSYYAELEQKEEVLRQFKLMQWLLAARAEVNHKIHAVQISRFLADVATVIIEQVTALAIEALRIRHPEIGEIIPAYAILAYGKLGSREMNYDSDLDLVFLHQVEPQQEGLVIRLTQKILHMLTARLASGVLYAVDTRLRPSGSAGLLVSTVAAFIDYQRHQAWTWEHQALIRARVVVGRPLFVRQLRLLKQEILGRAKDRAQVAEAVKTMRAKVGWQPESIKLAPGGLLDLEFYLQYLLLSQEKDSMASVTHSLTLMKKLWAEGALTEKSYRALYQAYRSFHQALHQQVLVGYRPDLDRHFKAVQVMAALA